MASETSSREPCLARTYEQWWCEGSSFLITRHKLTGHNYHQWAKAVLMFITGRGKDEYLFSTTEPPKKDDKRFKVWNTENNLVMSWLINAMDTEIGQNFLFYDTAHEIWMATKETYSTKRRKQKKSMMGTTPFSNVRKDQHSSPKAPQTFKKEPPWCDHCRTRSHERNMLENTWKPADWKSNKEKEA
ncbi:hypothetical protein AAG906_001788 [Vitis piasezkii]